MAKRSRKNNAKLGLVGKHLVFEIEENQRQAGLGSKTNTQQIISFFNITKFQIKI